LGLETLGFKPGKFVELFLMGGIWIFQTTFLLISMRDPVLGLMMLE
jgi:hypothetical protein